MATALHKVRVRHCASAPLRAVMLLLLMALFCRGMIADGFMPDFNKDAFGISICDGGPGMASMPMAMPIPMAGMDQAQDHHPQKSHGGHASPCPFAVGFVSLLTAMPVQTLPALLFTAFVAPAACILTVGRYRGNTSPRGPPPYP